MNADQTVLPVAIRAADQARAILNILDDLTGERTGLRDTQKAVLNILEDATADRRRFGDAQKAMLNILTDFGEEKGRLQQAQRASLNLLEDFDAERLHRERAEAQTRRLNEELEARIGQRTAELSSANQELEAFVYATSHELRTPLRAIDGFAHALTDDLGPRLDDESKDSLRRVREAAQRMSELIDRMQLLARLGNRVLRPHNVDLAALAANLVERLRKGDPGRVVEVLVTPCLVGNGDRELLTIVLGNLLSNAWHFTRTQPVARIEVGTTAVAEGQAIYVRDNGIGFDVAHAGKLFQPFERLHSSRDSVGAGLGLPTIRRIVLRHGGRVWAEGAVGKGATFYFTLAPPPASAVS